MNISRNLVSIACDNNMLLLNKKLFPAASRNPKGLVSPLLKLAPTDYFVANPKQKFKLSNLKNLFRPNNNSERLIEALNSNKAKGAINSRGDFVMEDLSESFEADAYSRLEDSIIKVCKRADGNLDSKLYIPLKKIFSNPHIDYRFNKTLLVDRCRNDKFQIDSRKVNLLKDIVEHPKVKSPDELAEALSVCFNRDDGYSLELLKSVKELYNCKNVNDSSEVRGILWKCVNSRRILNKETFDVAKVFYNHPKTEKYSTAEKLLDLCKLHPNYKIDPEKKRFVLRMLNSKKCNSASDCAVVINMSRNPNGDWKEYLLNATNVLIKKKEIKSVGDLIIPLMHIRGSFERGIIKPDTNLQKTIKFCTSPLDGKLNFKLLELLDYKFEDRVDVAYLHNPASTNKNTKLNNTTFNQSPLSKGMFSEQQN